jgi:hypothetical protein
MTVIQRHKSPKQSVTPHGPSAHWPTGEEPTGNSSSLGCLSGWAKCANDELPHQYGPRFAFGPSRKHFIMRISSTIYQAGFIHILSGGFHPHSIRRISSTFYQADFIHILSCGFHQHFIRRISSTFYQADFINISSGGFHPHFIRRISS